MKIFIFALALFILLVGFIIFNYIYVNKTSDELAQTTARLSQSINEINALEEFWETKRPIIVLSSGMSKIDNIYCLIDSLRIYAKYGNTVEFECVRELLINAFLDLSEFESLKLEDIF